MKIEIKAILRLKEDSIFENVGEEFSPANMSV